MGYMLQCISIYSTNVAQESIEIGLIMLRAGQGDYLGMISSKINYLPPELLMDEKLQNKGTCKCSKTSTKRCWRSLITLTVYIDFITRCTLPALHNVCLWYQGRWRAWFPSCSGNCLSGGVRRRCESLCPVCRCSGDTWWACPLTQPAAVMCCRSNQLLLSTMTGWERERGEGDRGEDDGKFCLYKSICCVGVCVTLRCISVCVVVRFVYLFFHPESTKTKKKIYLRHKVRAQKNSLPFLNVTHQSSSSIQPGSEWVDRRNTSAVCWWTSIVIVLPCQHLSCQMWRK